jgi:hypothetical protein
VPGAEVVAETVPCTGQPAASHASGRNVRPLSDAIVVHVHTMEEKGSDVNLAVHILNDAWKDLYDAAVVISNDTDLTAPIALRMRFLTVLLGPISTLPGHTDYPRISLNLQCPVERPIVRISLDLSRFSGDS